MWTAQDGMLMGTRNGGGHFPSAAQNSEKIYRNRWWFRTRHLMKEPRTSGRAGKGEQRRKVAGSLCAFITRKEEFAHLKERDKVQPKL